jgi:putative spermidine/putrescine transport system permease protein
MNHPQYGKPKGPLPHLLLVYPALALLLLFVGPMLVMLAISFFKRIQQAFFEPAFVLENYQHALDPFFLKRILVSLLIAALAAFLSLLISLPFTFFLTRLRRPKQVPYLVLLMAVLSLSEVIIGFSWSLILSKTSGLSNIFVWLGLMPEAVSWVPGFLAMLSALVYISLPLGITVLYPSFSRLDKELTEAATTLGASPVVSFFTVVIPVLRQNVVSGFILMFIFVLGSYLVPQVLGRPEHWTLPVLITDQAIQKSNLPLAAALAMLLLIASATLSFVTLRFSNQRAPS